MSRPPDDFRSDTVTRPTPAMRRAIAEAEVGDDALGDDPTVAALEAHVAELLGKEAALFFPSGIMANQTAIHVLARPGTEVICEAAAHILDWEDGAPALWSRVQLRPVPSHSGVMDPDDVAAAIREPSPYRPATSLVCVENTHNAGGGAIAPLENLQAIRDIAAAAGLPVHLDGARLWNASVASGVAERAFAACADTVMVTLSKGLGAPVGSVLAASEAVIARAWRVRRRLGGGMRQAGLLAAAGLHALEHHRDRLAEDHARAIRLAELLAELPALEVVPPQTNIVIATIRPPELDAPTLARRAREHGLLLSEFGSRRIRLVTHMDVGDEAITRAAHTIARTVG